MKVSNSANTTNIVSKLTSTPPSLSNSKACIKDIIDIHNNVSNIQILPITNKNHIINSQALQNFSKEKIENIFLYSLDYIALVATPQELKSIFIYILKTYPYQSSLKQYNNVNMPPELLNEKIIEFYGTLKFRKDFAEYIKNDPLINKFNSIRVSMENSFNQNPSGGFGVYARYSAKILAAISAAKNNDLVLANDLIKNILDNFRTNIICCKDDQVNINNVISLFILVADFLKPEFTEKYITQNIDIFFNSLESAEPSKNIFIILFDRLAFEILEKKLVMDQCHKYLREKANEIDPDQMYNITLALFYYVDAIRNINNDDQSCQDWNITNWYLLSNCPSKNQDEFIQLSAYIIVQSEFTGDVSHNEKIIKFFNGTTTGIILEQIQKCSTGCQDMNVLNSIKEKDVHYMLLSALKFLKKETMSKSDQIKQAFITAKYRGKESLAISLAKCDPQRAKEEIIKIKDLNSFSLIRASILLNPNKKIFNIIQNSKFFSHAKAYLHFIAAQTFAANKNKMSLALNHINEAAKLVPEEDKYISFKNIIEMQIKEANNIEKDENNEQLFDVVIEDEKIEKVIFNSAFTNNINTILAEIDVNKSNLQINEMKNDQEAQYFNNLNIDNFCAYWQSKHDKEVTTLDQRQATEVTTTWEIDNYNINSVETIEIQNKFDVTYYIYVPTKVKEALGEEWSIFEDAINKGFVRSKKGQSGIKYLSSENAEIKAVTSNNRVLGKHYIVKNDHIFIFDQIVNHKGVRRNL